MTETHTTEESSAALAVCALASALQDLLYFSDDPSLSNRAKTIMGKCYRALKQATDLYFDPAENPLVWNPALGTPFAKPKGKR